MLLALLVVCVAAVDRVGDPLTHDDVAQAAPSTLPTAEGVALDALAILGPPLPLGSTFWAAPAAGPLDTAELARRAGDYERAAALLRELANGADGSVAKDALLLLAVTQIDAGNFAAGADVASELMGRDVDATGRATALFVLGRARRAAGDCLGALAAFDEAQKAAPDFGPYTDLQAAYCLAALNDRAGQHARATRAAESAVARLTKVDALEHQVSATVKVGDLDAAIKASEGLLASTTSRTYRAQTLTSLGTIARDAGKRDLAASSWATVVAELPEAPAAVGALDGLQGLNATNLVAPDEPAAVLFFARRNGEAIAALRAAIAGGLSPERTARARLYLGQAQLRIGATDEGARTLLQVAGDVPSSDLAARAALRAGEGFETDGRYREASDAYQKAATILASSAASQEAQSRLVFALVMRGAVPEALQAAQALAASDADGRWKGLGLLWAAKGLARAGDAAQAQAVLARAAELDLEGFGGLRSRAIVDGDARAVQTPTPLDMGRLQPTAADLAAVEGWLAARGADTATIEREQRDDQHVRRAALLYRVGLPEWASWELQELAGRWAADAGRLYGLAKFAAERGETTQAMRFAMAAQRASGAPLTAQPRLLQQLIYPIPYADTIAAHAEKRGIDPLLFVGLMRQESAFDPRARSSANALGLAQVIPSTGQGIATALGRPTFSNEELFRPVVAIEFGAFYLGRQLTQYDGRVYPALSAYNAGGGNVNRWLDEFGAGDPDLFARLIPFAETNHYVQIVYENYQHYRRLYR